MPATFFIIEVALKVAVIKCCDKKYFKKSQVLNLMRGNLNFKANIRSSGREKGYTVSRVCMRGWKPNWSRCYSVRGSSAVLSVAGSLKVAGA